MGKAAPVHSFAASGVLHILEALGSMRVDVAALCGEIGLDPDRLRDAAPRVGAAKLLALFAAAEARSGDPLIALHVAELVRFGSVAGYVVWSQNTVADAVR